VAVADIYLEHCVGQVVGNDTLNLNYVVFCQSLLTSNGFTLHVLT
jgi:hypothetical protein